MQMVGATKYFIRKPFIIKNIKLSLISSIIASIGLAILIAYINQTISIMEVVNISLLAVLFVIIIAGLVGSGLYYQRRRSAAIDELAGIFSYTAELLAAGDEFREAIYNCYESLCQILMRRGFLRRDFETVREFEIAIRSALPISEQSLIALDRIFEEARYSSHVLGEGHRQNAQIALNAVLQEIDQLQDIPVRDDYIASE